MVLAGMNITDASTPAKLIQRVNEKYHSGRVNINSDVKRLITVCLLKINEEKS